MAMRLDHGAVVMINPDWQSEHPLPIALDPLPPAAGANLTAAEAIAADHDASAVLGAGAATESRRPRNAHGANIGNTAVACSCG
jgi:hypothetical protein